MQSRLVTLVYQSARNNLGLHLMWCEGHVKDQIRFPMTIKVFSFPALMNAIESRINLLLRKRQSTKFAYSCPYQKLQIKGDRLQCPATIPPSGPGIHCTSSSDKHEHKANKTLAIVVNLLIPSKGLAVPLILSQMVDNPILYLLTMTCFW